MSNLAGPWAGKIYGTNTGNIFVVFEQSSSQLTGKLRINDSTYGISIYTFTGTENSEIILKCTPETGRDGVELGSVTVRGRLNANGTISGNWETTIGTAGTFHLWPHNVESPKNVDEEPEQVCNRSVTIGSVRILRDEIKNIIKLMEKDFVNSKMIVTYQQNGSDITKFATSFIESFDQLNELRTLKLFIQEPEVAGINRTVNIDLLENAESTIRVSGVNESWVVGKTETLRRSLAKYEKNVITNYRKYGLNLNTLIFLLMIVFASEISTWPKRFIFVGTTYFLLVFFHWVHSKLIPNTIILLNPRPSGFWGSSWPTLLSWLIAFSSATAAAGLMIWLAR